MCHCRIPPFCLRLLQRVWLRKNFFSLPTWNWQVRFKMACKDVWNIYNVRKQYSSPRSWLKERRMIYVGHSAWKLYRNIWSYSKAKFQVPNLGPLSYRHLLKTVASGGPWHSRGKVRRPWWPTWTLGQIAARMSWAWGRGIERRKLRRPSWPASKIGPNCRRLAWATSIASAIQQKNSR